MPCNTRRSPFAGRLFCRALLSCGALLALLLLTALTASAQQPSRPNILWISVEDMSPRISPYGDPIARTPNLERLARESTRYRRAFTSAGVCAPSRAAIITGMYQNAIGAQHMRTATHDVEGLPGPYEAVPPPYVKAFPEYLRAAGYFTTNSVKTDYQFGQPFTVWDEHSRQAHWRSPKRRPGQPFFSVFNITTTHESQSWTTPEDTLSTDPASIELPPYYPDTPLVRRQLARHYDNIARMDEQVGRLLSQLDEDGLSGNTVVFFWSDHGDGLPRAKRWLYDSGLHVPLMIRWPGRLEPGSVSEELVSMIDLAPTVLSLSGVPVPVHMQGQPFLGSQKAQPRRYVYAARDRFDEAYDMMRAVRDGRFKYIRSYYPNQPYVLHIPYRNRSAIMQELFRLDAAEGLSPVQALWMADVRAPEELYDTERDPHEIDNLVDDPAYRDTLERLRSALEAWMEEVDVWAGVPESEMVERMWPGGEQPATAAPVIVPQQSTTLEPERDAAYSAPVKVLLYSATEGASLAYTMEEGEEAHWKLYSGPILLPQGRMRLRARAVRYGYQESNETVQEFTVGPQILGSAPRSR